MLFSFLTLCYMFRHLTLLYLTYMYLTRSTSYGVSYFVTFFSLPLLPVQISYCSKLEVTLTCIVVNTWKLKCQLDATDWFLYCKIYCSLNMFRASSGAQELYIWLLPVVLGVFGLKVVGLVCSCGFAGCCSSSIS